MSTNGPVGNYEDSKINLENGKITERYSLKTYHLIC